jgi:sporulation protein YlmC with PRC-barrel domain
MLRERDNWAMEQDFHFGTAVYSGDGKHSGTLRRLIVDSKSLDVHAIVVHPGRNESGASQ